jgi:hypothetical protein
MTATDLSPHIHLARIGRDLVLLDLRADTYLCIPDGVAALRPTPDLTRVQPVDPEVRAALIDAGILDRAAAGGRRRPPALPRQDVVSVPVARLRLREALRLAACLWDLAWRYRGQPLDRIVAYAARAPAELSDRPAEAIRLARLFHEVVPWLPISRKCLVRSFVLLRFLQRSGLNAAWVFGVRTWPFAAHCWLQLGDVALDDAPERLAAYEPIYVVG